MPESQTNLAWATLLEIDLGRPDGRQTASGGGAGRPGGGQPGHGPAHERLARALRAAIRAGRLAEGSAVPPSRALAEELGCSRWVVTEAYGQLVAEGYLAARTGSATRVSWSPGLTRPRRQGRSRPKGPSIRYDLRPGLPDVRAFPRRRWAEAVRAVIGSAVHYDLGLPDPSGHPDLRRTLAEYLRRSRGAQAQAETVTVCAGICEGLVRVCRAMRAGGITDLAVEEPGWGRVRAAAASAGLRVHPVGVDDEGLRVSDLARLDRARAVVVGAAHQFPTGAVLSAARRGELVRWARDVDGYVIEDDYDAEFRYDRRPVAVMQGMDPARVFLLGSVTKTLSPALGLGWLVAPGAWAADLRTANVVAPAPPVLDQLALATFIDQGWYDGHLRAARRRLRARRDLLLATLATQPPTTPAAQPRTTPAAQPVGRVSGTAAGLHVVLYLPPGADAARVVARAATAGLGLTTMDTYRSDGPGPPALVLGYGNLGDAEVEPAVAALRAALAG